MRAMEDGIMYWTEKGMFWKVQSQYFLIFMFCRADLILSGHLHGGLVRCPGIGAVVTPQGFLFPKYSGEMRREGEQTIVVSRGLGSHTINIRLFNMPEVIAIEVCVR